MTEFGEKLRFLRLRKSLRQKELARRTGLRPSTISDLESGKSTPRRRTRALLATALGMPIEEFEHATVMLEQRASGTTSWRRSAPSPPRLPGAVETVARGEANLQAARERLGGHPALLWVDDGQGHIAMSDAPGHVPVPEAMSLLLRRPGAAADPGQAPGFPCAALYWARRGECVSFTISESGRHWAVHLAPQRDEHGDVRGVVGGTMLMETPAPSAPSTSASAPTTPVPAVHETDPVLI